MTSSLSRRRFLGAAAAGTVGAVAYVVDVTVFNLLRAETVSPIANK